MSDQELYDFDAVIVHETEKALLLDSGDIGAIWFPKSIVVNNGDGTFTVPERYAMSKGLI